MGNIIRDFIAYHNSMMGLLNEICLMAKEECDADILQKLNDLEETSKFVVMDLNEYNGTLEELTKYYLDHREDEATINEERDD